MNHSRLIASASLAAALACTPAGAQYLNLSTLPLYVGANVTPLVMLAISKDQQLYKKAYNDYSDLDSDGALETTYKHAIDYYGYFDPYKCYSYSSANKRFEPQADTSALASADRKYCDTVAGEWSGNFLNWATMTRMDAVRKLLYGGLRTPTRASGDGSGLSDGDSATGTVLERAYLPNDAHSFAKYYNGSDITRLTNYTPPTTVTTSATSRAIGTGNITLTVASTTGMATGDILEYAVTATPTTHYMRGNITTISGSNITISVNANNMAGSGTYAAWTVTNLSKAGLTICNTTLGGSSPQDKSQTNTNLPRMRVAKGNFTLWAGNERWQCLWGGETVAGVNGGGAVSASNSNNYASSGIPASSSAPTLATHGTGTGLGDMFVRVQACVSTLLGTEKCKQYGGTVYKPIGLLQVYGETGLLQFGLMTGSYAKNVSGGVLRKNVGVLTDEIESTDGTFKAASLAAGYAGIINTLNRMRIYGYYYGDGTYLGASGDNCTWQLTSITQNNCTSWGNPMSEIYYESLRYFAGGKPTVSSVPQPTGAYSFTLAGSKDNSLGLPLAAWSDPVTQNNYCTPLNTIVFNASVSTTDNDQIPSGSTKSYLGTINLSTSFSAAMGAKTASGWTDEVGKATGENIHGGSYFVGRSGASTDEYCTTKTVSSLGSISGICPEGPTLGGSYLISGLAYGAHINRIRDDLTVPASNTKALKVDTYAVQLATNVPRLSIQLSGESTPRVIIQPTYRLIYSGQGGGALVDLRIISQEVGTNYAKGRIYLNWEDSEQGGDYDQDMWGILSYCLQTSTTTACAGQAANTISVTTDSIAESTSQPQGFGYIISGTTKDGPHFHSGIENFDYTDSTNVTVSPTGYTNASGGCSTCNPADPATTVVYALGTSTGQSLKDPLWYAAKWGGFKETGSGGNNIPDIASEYDVLDANGAANADGVPDNYFLVNNPLGLEAAMDKAFVAILTTSSASSVATNSTSLNTGSRVYQARFNSNDWSGQLMSFTIDLNGVISTTAEWDTAQKINAQDPATRVIYTWNDSSRTPATFRWANLSATQQTWLNTLSSGATDSRGSERVDYIRGSATNEGLSATNFRRRTSTKLGDIVNSNPHYVGPPNAGHSDADYALFKATWANRTPVIYVGANDGMMHAVDASTNAATQGKVVMSYVPSQVYSKLAWVTQQNYSHRFYVDGTPEVEDVYINGAWRSVLIGTLGGGGQGIFALDVTDPTQFSEANVNDIVLWEFTDADYRGVGYTYGQPKIAKMANGKWAAIFGVGYNDTYTCTGTPCSDRYDSLPSTTGHGRVMVVFIENGAHGATWSQGTDYVVLNTRVGSSGSPNGTAPPTPVDVDGDGIVDYLYFGDQQGNLWKWNVTDTNPSNWVPAFGTTGSPEPLYSARDGSNVAQPITTSPQFYAHPNGGYLIYFGTGMYLQPADPNAPYQLQTFYAIWDQQTKTWVNAVANPSASRVSSSVSAPRDSAILQKQSILAEVTVSGIAYRVTSDHAPDWDDVRGWYLDLLLDPNENNSGTLAGERIVFDPLIRNGKAIIDTLVPSTVSCDSGGTSWLLDLDAVTGGRLTESPFDVNGDKAFSTSDQVTIAGIGTVYVSGRQSQVGITPRPTVIAGTPGKEYKVTSGSTGGMESILENPGGSSGSPVITRRSWREILRN